MKNYVEKIRIKRGMSRTKLAKELNMCYQNLFDIERNKTSITNERLEDFCRILGCTVSELYGQVDYTISDNKKMIKVKFYEGNNDYRDFENSELKDLFLPEDFFKILGIKNYSNILCLKNLDKNMEPTISFGDFIIVDESCKKIYNNKVYLINEGETLKIKRIKRDSPFDSIVTIISDNQIEGEYPPYKVTIEQIDKMVLGQVISYRRNIN